DQAASGLRRTAHTLTPPPPPAAPAAVIALPAQARAARQRSTDTSTGPQPATAADRALAPVIPLRRRGSTPRTATSLC
uniref:hypothetical protein n=1 Tax=Peterkaempfera griseoplana TaxID=66896 RepID=UPI0006E2CB4E